MAEFLVTWETDTDDDDVETPREAAELARRMQTAPGSVATVFTVLNVATGEATVVDLYDEAPDKLRAGLTDGQAMELIRSQLSGVSWSPSTFEEIARIVRLSGRDVLDVSPPGCDECGAVTELREMIEAEGLAGLWTAEVARERCEQYAALAGHLLDLLEAS